MQLNIPLYLTIGRVAAIPVVLALFYTPLPYARQVAALLFIAAAITDILDGYLARRWNQTSAFGAFLDPVADKLIVSVALVMLLRRRKSKRRCQPAPHQVAAEVAELSRRLRRC